ncbi:MAG TPA: helix-turn-helix domain-containing protein [Terriglobales bacterium]|nr:helix-turn-helix domain-containing protein [Terriglobales bacterium]
MKKPNVNHNGNHGQVEARQTLSSAVQDDAFEPLLDSEEAAALLKIHPKTLQKLARSGEVAAIQIGKLWRFRASALDDWIRKIVS